MPNSDTYIMQIILDQTLTDRRVALSKISDKFPSPETYLFPSNVMYNSKWGNL